MQAGNLVTAAVLAGRSRKLFKIFLLGLIFTSLLPGGNGSNHSGEEPNKQTINGPNIHLVQSGWYTILPVPESDDQLL
jgi:hypothetical protein